MQKNQQQMVDLRRRKTRRWNWFHFKNGIWRRIGSSLVWILKRYHGVNIGPGGTFVGLPIFQNSGVIEIGRRVTLVSTPSGNVLWCSRPCTFVTEFDAEINIGDQFSASGVCLVAKRKITIGNNVKIGANVVIMDNDMHDPSNPIDRGGVAESPCAPVRIEDNAWIGANAVVLKGVRIGRNAVVGAGVVVRKDVADGCAVIPPANLIKLIKLTS